jgi:hypothetical protein
MTCLDCKNCKIKFPINKNNPLKTSLATYPKINGVGGYRSMVCTEGQWLDQNGNQVSILYIEQNIQAAKLGNSRYLNQVSGCLFFEDMGEE